MDVSPKRSGTNPGSPTSPAESAFALFVDQLLALFAELAPDADVDQTADFVTELNQQRNRLRAAASPRDITRVAELCLRTCQRYLDGSRRYIGEREAELRELITILREAVSLLAGQTSAFNTELLGSTHRFGALVQLEDIRELKRQLTIEVATLKRAIAERQRRDDETYASLNMRVEVLQMKLDRAEEEAALDSLTRVANRRSFDRALRRMTANARQSRTSLTLAMIDVDDFKAINDTHGHPIGDRVLLCAAMWLGKSLRQSDFIARYGGEEFAIILNDATVDEVEARLNQVLADISSRGFEYDAGTETKTVRFTLSCGAAELAAGDSDEDLLKRADDALYEAKRQGRSRVVTRKRARIGSLISRS